MDFVIGLAVGVGVTWWIMAALRKHGSSRRESQRRERPAPRPAPTPVVNDRLYELADEAAKHYEKTASPRDFEAHPSFENAVSFIEEREFTTEDLLAYYTGDNLVIACIALAALARREGDDDLLEPILSGIGNVGYYTRYFALRVLDERVDGRVLGPLLARLNDSWMSPFAERLIAEFVRKRRDRGDDEVDPDALAHHGRELSDWLTGVLRRARSDDLADRIESARRERVDVAFLRSFGRVWTAGDVPDTIIQDDTLRRRVAEIERVLRHAPPRSILLVGEAGVGKTTALQALAKKLLSQGWVLFQAGAVELLAGQTYMGELEKRLQNLLNTIRGRPRIVWIVPDLQELLLAGRHKYSRTSVLDFVRPAIEKGEITLIGEIRPEAHERLLQAQPQLRTITETVRFSPLGDEPTAELARAWVEHHSQQEPIIEPAVLEEAIHLAQQYLGTESPPGNLLSFLEHARQTRAARDGSAPVRLSIDDLLQTLGQVTGLPTSILDEREGLNLDALEKSFNDRVIGQPEAVQCLVERVALIKAGLTDPTRPMGVFLFTGPTGTGKTELAKALASYLFGSDDRMIRLDMSEFQAPDSLQRILGTRQDEERRNALVHQIGKQPFSVVLLDEIEKAHETVWDLFLQVFDDGRLTDQLGNLSDFRHAIVIMTSNVGADASQGAGLAFGQSPVIGLTDAEVEGALTAVFRREFLNRIDRIVVFRSLSRAVMRKVLLKELDSVLGRRGLRNRQWAVEWDESALEFFLGVGFSPELGARPLKRAIERHLLSPLARTIVHHQAPEGDQFLFVRSNGEGIQVQFVDPDAPVAPESMPDPVRDDELELATIALETSGSAKEIERLRTSARALDERVRSEEWQREKAKGLDAASEPGFWTSPDRFAILGRTEYLDRIAKGVGAANKLLRRVTQDGASARLDLIQRLAMRLYLLETAVGGLDAGLPRDAYLRVEAVRDPRADVRQANTFASEVAEMYARWALARRMDWRELERCGGGDELFAMTAAIEGYGAYAILAPEAGFHSLTDGTTKGSHRVRARVRVVPQPEGPEDDGLEAARRAIETAASPDLPNVVRRYRRGPSPLVRDSVRGWRCGRWERVLGGDFDLVR